MCVCVVCVCVCACACVQWLQLKQRKAQMVKLFQRLQDYQFEKVREQPDKALTEDTRPLSEEDIIRCRLYIETCTYICRCTIDLHLQ